MFSNKMYRHFFTLDRTLEPFFSPEGEQKAEFPNNTGYLFVCMFNLTLITMVSEWNIAAREEHTK